MCLLQTAVCPNCSVSATNSNVEKMQRAKPTVSKTFIIFRIGAKLMKLSQNEVRMTKSVFGSKNTRDKIMKKLVLGFSVKP